MLLNPAHRSENDQRTNNSACIQKFPKPLAINREHQHNRREYPNHGMHSLMDTVTQAALAVKFRN